jgi:hypothetical protein
LLTAQRGFANLAANVFRPNSMNQKSNGIRTRPVRRMTLANWTGMVETELFAQTYESYGLATVRYPVLEVTATVEPFENGRGFSLRVLRAGKSRAKAR